MIEMDAEEPSFNLHRSCLLYMYKWLCATRWLCSSNRSTNSKEQHWHPVHVREESLGDWYLGKFGVQSSMDAVCFLQQLHPKFVWSIYIDCWLIEAVWHGFLNAIIQGWLQIILKLQRPCGLLTYQVLLPTLKFWGPPLQWNVESSYKEQKLLHK